MSYHFSKTIDGSIDDVEGKVRERLAGEGFGVLTYIDVQSTLKAKLGVDFKAYRILGACNPPFAHKALQAEDKIGTMLPCNVVVQEVAPGKVEVSAIDPVESMKAVSNDALTEVVGEVRAKLQKVVEGL